MNYDAIKNNIHILIINYIKLYLSYKNAADNVRKEKLIKYLS